MSTDTSEAARRDARRRRIRTKFQSFVSACAVLVVILPVIMQSLDGRLPGPLAAWLAGAALAITQVASTVTRIMNMPAVSDFIDRRMPWLSADPDAGQEGESL